MGKHKGRCSKSTGSNPVLTTNLHEFYLKLHANIIYMNKNILEEENIVLKKALQDLIDFHHHIGNEDCPYNRNYILVTMYNIAEKALNNVYLIKH